MKALIRLEISWISILTALRLELVVLLSFEEGAVIFWLGVEKGGVSTCGGGDLLTMDWWLSVSIANLVVALTQQLVLRRFRRSHLPITARLSSSLQDVGSSNEVCHNIHSPGYWIHENALQALDPRMSVSIYIRIVVPAQAFSPSSPFSMYGAWNRVPFPGSGWPHLRILDVARIFPMVIPVSDLPMTGRRQMYEGKPQRQM